MSDVINLGDLATTPGIITIRFQAPGVPDDVYYLEIIDGDEGFVVFSHCDGSLAIPLDPEASVLWHFMRAVQAFLGETENST